MIHEGEQLKFEGMALASDAVPDWYDQAWTVLLGLAAKGDPFTSEDVVAVVGLPRGDVSTNKNNAVGALISSAARKHIIHKVGYRNSKRPALHAAALAVWVGSR